MVSIAKYFPAFHRLDGGRVVIAGGGELARRKARLVYGEGVRLIFFAPNFEPEFLDEWQDRAELVWRWPTKEDFDGAALAFVGVEDDALAAYLCGLARAAKAPLNAVDRPELSDFITPSIIERGEISIGICTGGAAPVLGKKLRAEIEAILPSRLGQLATFARGLRARVSEKIAPAGRRAFWESFFHGPIAARFLAGDEAGAGAEAIAAIDHATPPVGVVHIVGAGPGDPDLITLRALRLLQSADVILYDRLVSDEILTLARRDADRFFVGKAKANHAVPQEEIEQRMIAFAREGKIVVRLKGGDPFVFGRGGEELETVRAAGIPVHVTPGITAATGCASAAGMPLTHREHAQAVTFVTGHAKKDTEPDLDWRSLAQLGHTLVVYMGVAKAEAIQRQLIDHGRAASTPIAIVENGTRPDQKILKGVLGSLSPLVKAGGVTGPALLIIGEVAALATPSEIVELLRDGRNGDAPSSVIVDFNPERQRRVAVGSADGEEFAAPDQEKSREKVTA
ncbi:MAG: siroheme synthase CysG [Pseudomonadota bacterium]